MKTLPLLLVCLLCSACDGLQNPLLSPRERADRLAAAHGWSTAVYQAGEFRLLAYEHLTSVSRQLSVYIEGDGRAWLDSHTPAADPTPPVPHGLELAVEDPSPNAVYLARPCQFLVAAELARCDPNVWLFGRYSNAVVAAVDMAVDAAKRKANAERLTLVGYSGGGAIAVLVASRRNDVTKVVTVVADLDTEAWVKRYDLTPLRDSLNPADVAQKVEVIPQVHFVGTADRTVGPAIVDSYVARARDRSRIQVVRLPERHECCWRERWRDLLARYVMN